MSKKIKSSSVVGGIAAIATAGTAVTTASAVVGGSAATIMSATAGTVGSIVGGGMATGAIITAAAPVAVLGAVAYGLFKFFED